MVIILEMAIVDRPRQSHPERRRDTREIKFDVVDLLDICFKELYQYNGEYGDLKSNTLDGNPSKTNFPSQIIGLFCAFLMLLSPTLLAEV